ncbi:unnamed protein product [Chondrus crispus]|uniref:Uncharacterized protein n=1 Tax=Chondrus crispus TaxID=2769 RepID=R7Q170_CHOCR|nr:unnamed protein product [Chondrus crispus]CDF32372.1 unnamed protein product [Chondrus crispus]|eukprot:XP_005712037.1 unnamed protein product [Chondrus crispus]
MVCYTSPSVCPRSSAPLLLYCSFVTAAHAPLAQASRLPPERCPRHANRVRRTSRPRFSSYIQLFTSRPARPKAPAAEVLSFRHCGCTCGSPCGTHIIK